MFSQDVPTQPIVDLHGLNTTLMRLQPTISGIAETFRTDSSWRYKWTIRVAQ